MDHLRIYNDRHGQQLSSKNFRDAFIRVMREEKEEIESRINNITMATSFQPPVPMNAQNKYANMSL